jgi:hydroxymethylpyrimidine pyrophosphatase-like HAD family hydrolase
MSPESPFDDYEFPVKLVLADLDGTVTADELKVVDCEGLSVLKRYNERSRCERDYPPISLVTGRPHSYLEAFARFIATPLPSLFESGCGIHLPQNALGHEYIFHPALAAEGVAEAVARFRAWAEGELVAKRGAGFILGKRYATSLAAGDCCTVEELLGVTRNMPAELAPYFFVTRSVGVVDVTPLPLNKGVGFDWLLRYCRDELGLDVAAANVAGVGDSFNDMPFLERVGVSCAVANAAPALRDAVDYVTHEPTAKGVADVVKRAAALNRRLGYR